MKTRICVVALACLGVVVVTGCGPVRPSSFTTTQELGWVSFEVREGLTYDKAWDAVVALLVKDFDLDVVLRQEGYLRTEWMYTWVGEYRASYRVRVTAKFTPDRSTLQLKSEAQFLPEGQVSWIVGNDTRLLATLKADILGIISR